MEEDSDGETSSNRDAQRKLPRKSKGGSEPEAVVSVSRWERMDDADAEDDPSDNKRLKTSVSKGPSTDGKAGDRNHSSCELHDAIRRAHKKQVRWADEEEEVEGFHIGGIRRQVGLRGDPWVGLGMSHPQILWQQVPAQEIVLMSAQRGSCHP
eukprot:evm.model.scf_18.16 EVM.evm.TU.scf_18.16   scf_18:99263-99721(-)